MNIKKTAIVLSAFLLAACSASGSASVTPSASASVEGIVEPITYHLDPIQGFNEEGQEKILDVYGEDHDLEQSILSVGSDAPDFDMPSYKDNSMVNVAKDYKGKNVVLEVAAYWCEFCQQESKDYIEKFRESYPDVTFIQAFMFGARDDKLNNSDGTTSTVDTVQKFYDDAGVPIPDDLHILTQCDDLKNYMINTINLDSFPCFIFINSEGKVSWVKEGLTKEEQFAKLVKYAFSSDDYLYDDIPDGAASPRSFIRTWENVRADLTNEAVQQVEDIENNENAVSEAFGDMGIPVSYGDETVTDINGAEVKPSEWDGITDYLFISETSQKNADVIKTWNQFQEKAAKDGANINFVTILTADDTKDASKFYENMEVKPEGIVLDAYSSLPSALNPLLLYTVPTIIYTDGTKQISLGAHGGKFDLDTLEKAQNLYAGDNPVCMQVKE